MKYHFLGTFCVFLAVMGLTETARADFNSSMTTNKSVNLPATRQVDGNRQAPIAPVMNSLELEIFKQVNQYRQSQKLAPLVFDPAVSAQAKAHSETMAKIGGLSHDGFNERIDSISDKIVYKSAAENIASNRGYKQPDVTAVQGWIESPGHQHNMIGRYNLTGIGVAQSAQGEYYFTQIFVRKPR
jgi:uncharacterized protein YkwD